MVSSLACVLLFAAFQNGSVAQSATQQPSAYTPGATTVAVLPVANVSGEKWEQLKKNMASEVYKYACKEFTKKGFVVMDDAAVEQALTDNKFNPDDEESFNKDTFFGLGEKLHANLILFAAVEDSDQKIDRWRKKDEGMCHLKIWLLDVSAHSPIYSDKSFVDRSDHGKIFLNFQNERGSRRQVQAAVNCMRDALEDFLKPYPDAKK